LLRMGDVLQVLWDNPLEHWAAEHDLAFLHPTFILIGLLVLVVVFLLLSLRGSKKRPKGSIHLITGITNSGKTTLYARLYRGSFDKTVSSLLENEAKFPLSGHDNEDKIYHIVDYPGHLEVKNKLFSDFVPNAKSIIFMVDAVNFPAQVRDVAGYLYMLLMNKSVNDLEIPILVACNKSEMITAQEPEKIRKQLEKELYVCLFADYCTHTVTIGTN